jgi:imidazole glycerol-phosphate synthase subunit HisH
MSKILIGLVDYGVGNHASLCQTLSRIGFRSFVSIEPLRLVAADLILLPGVGAFAPAMQALRSGGLDMFLQDEASSGKPVLGICLGMQLLGRSSNEDGFTVGLNLIPADAVQLSGRRYHIGWNNINHIGSDPLFIHSHGQDFYFNHSYAFNMVDKFTMCSSKIGEFDFVSAVRVNNIVGMQFHPEKSQRAGRELLYTVIHGLCNA